MRKYNYEAWKNGALIVGTVEARNDIEAYRKINTEKEVDFISRLDPVFTISVKPKEAQGGGGKNGKV